MNKNKKNVTVDDRLRRMVKTEIRMGTENNEFPFLHARNTFLISTWH